MQMVTCCPLQGVLAVAQACGMQGLLKSAGIAYKVGPAAFAWGGCTVGYTSHESQKVQAADGQT